MKLSLTLSLSIVLLFLVQAQAQVITDGESVNVSLYAGESMTFYTDYDKVGYLITNNTHDIEGIDVYYNGTNTIMLSTALNYLPDSFIITFYHMDDEVDPEVIEIVRYRGGGSNTIRYVNNTITDIIYLNATLDNVSIDLEKKDRNYLDDLEQGFDQGSYQKLFNETLEDVEGVRWGLIMLYTFIAVAIIIVIIIIIRRFYD